MIGTQMPSPRQPRPLFRLFAAAVALLAVSAFAVPAVPPIPPAGTETAREALLTGRVGLASALLQQALAANPKDGAAHLLFCRVDYALGLTDPAVAECQAAAAALPNDSDAAMWLGRALGVKAERGSKLTAFSTARQVRDAFERAVALSPGNADAASDLAEFYIGAPYIVGGGKDKAARLSASVAPRFPALSHRILALLAAQSGDLRIAENEFKAAVAVAHTPETYIDLGHFYQDQKRPDDAAAAIRQAVAADPQHGPPLVDAASILTDAGREPALAEQCLREYIRSSHQSDAAPVFKAELALGRLLARRGDQPGAQAQYQAAAALAPQYAPARKAAGLQ